MNVALPPAKPLMIWDGDCHFCRHWIERWRVITSGEVEYETSQNVAERFPEISREEFQRAVVFIETNGEVFVGAAAVYRSLRCRSYKRWLWWSYDHVPGFAAISEFGYKIVARHRRIGSVATRWLWGNDVRPPTYFWARRWFLRGLGLVYLIAFVSLWTQIDGLIGANGILPIGDFLAAARDQLGPHAMSILPTLCSFNASNTFLHILCGGGVVFSVLLIVGIAPAISAFSLFVFYLSLSIAGQTFLSFQWDILLLEAGFLSIFLAPWQLWPRRNQEQPVSKIAMFLLKFLLFKLMLMSGVVKLTSGDDCWWDLTALDFHYWSQPLPTIFGWWFDQHAEWFKKFSVAFCLVVEIMVPFLMWAPRRPRLIAAGLLIFLQLAIALTGNYCFFNLLTIVLCLLLIDDAAIGRNLSAAAERRYNERLSIFGAMVVLVLTLPINAWLIYSAFKPEVKMPRPMRWVYGRIEPFRVANGYGLFRVMTKDRREIVIEGSGDGIEWKAYEFKWKPGDVNRAPGWCAPHQPRLDWQMWFAALSGPRQNRWLMRTIVCLFENKKEVTHLFARNPFPDAAPHFIRARFYRYRFANAEEHRRSGVWWKREELGEYLQTVSAEQLR